MERRALFRHWSRFAGIMRRRHFLLLLLWGVQVAAIGRSASPLGKTGALWQNGCDTLPPAPQSFRSPPAADQLICHDIAAILNVEATWRDSAYRYFIGGPVFPDSCGIVTVSARDSIVYGDCDSVYARLYRIFSATKAGGPRWDSTVTYLFRYPDFSRALKLADHFVITCQAAQAPVPATYPYLLNAFGDSVRLTENGCDYSVSFEDQEFAVCGGSRRIERIVKVFNWCDDSVQLLDSLEIKIGDFQGPVAVNLADTVVVAASPFECSLTFALNEEVLTSLFHFQLQECQNAVSVQGVVESYLPDLNTQGDSSFQLAPYRIHQGVVYNVPQGLHRLIFFIDDVCGNTSRDTVTFRVVDRSGPVMKCVDRLRVSLNGDRYGQVAVADINEGSWDNCRLTGLKIRREVHPECYAFFDYNGNGKVLGEELDSNGFTRLDDIRTRGDYVEVYCCDLDRNPKVELLGWDASGNASFCWTVLEVEDKLAPVCLAPADTVVVCRDPSLDNLALFGMAGHGPDSCGLVTIEELPVIKELDQCGAGVIERRWQAVKFANTSSELRSEVCRQQIRVLPDNRYSICFPADETYACGDTLAGVQVTYLEEGCNLLAIRVSDEETYTPEAEACFAIYRTIEVIDWCTYDGLSGPVEIPRDADGDGVPGDESVCLLVRANGLVYLDRDQDELNVVPNAKGYWTDSQADTALVSRGFWRYRQLIKLFDDTPPQVVFQDPGPFCSYSDDPSKGCPGYVRFPFSVQEECTDHLDLRVFWDRNRNPAGIDLDITATALQGTYPQYFIEGEFPIGRHAFVIIADDGCGNRSRWEFPFEVRDCKGPAPVCISGLSVVLDGTEGGTAIWVDDFLQKPVYDCSGQGPGGEVTVYSINRKGDSVYVAQKSVLFTCADSGQFIPVEIHAWDSYGNHDYCEAYVEVQANGPVCGPEGGQMAAIAGRILTPAGVQMEGVEVLLSGKSTHTDANGQFLFPAVPMRASYTLEPWLDEGHAEGVSTFDLVLVQKHILGLQPLQSPYQLIAADVNNSRSVTTFDLIQMRRVILKQDLAFPDNTSWRFVDAAYRFPDPANPWLEPFPEFMDLELNAPAMDVDFVGIKIGDVNDSAVPFLHMGAGVRSGRTPVLSDNSRLALKAFPNPFASEVRLRITSPVEGAGRLRVYDPTGRLCDQKEVWLEKGEETLRLVAGNDWLPGIYLIELTTPGFRGRTRVIRIR